MHPPRLLAILLLALSLLACGDDPPASRPDMSAPPDQPADLAPDLPLILDDAPADLPADMAPEDAAPDLLDDLATADMIADLDDDMSDDMEIDMDLDISGDMELDMSEDMPEDMPQPCDGIDCGLNGRCVEAQGAPSCDCDAGFTAVGLSCVPAAGPPAITSTAPTAVDEGATISYIIRCADPDGAPITLSVAADDTCGGAIVGADRYVAATDEDDGATSCLISVICSSGGGVATQQAAVAIAEVNRAPTFSPSANATPTRWGRQGSRAFTATDPDRPAQPLTFSLVSATCSFPVTVAPDGLMSWTCGPAVESCSATLEVSDGVAAASRTHTLNCTNAAPALSGTLTTTASEHTLYSRTLSCSDPDGDPVTLSAGVNTCGATFTPGAGDSVTVAFTPDELDGGTTCELEVRCADPLTQSGIARTITIAETNARPTLNNPGPISSRTGRPHSFQLTATDTDLPAQPLTFSLVNGFSPCPFLIAVSPAGLVSYTCSNANTSCAATLRVSDGVANHDLSVSLACTNTAPSVSDVAIVPDPITALGQTLTCQYTFHDAEGDPDMSTFQWRINNKLVSTSQTITGGYMANDDLRCFVIPSDGSAQGSFADATARGPDLAMVGAGGQHSCGVKDGRLRCWGKNDRGQLGDGATADSFNPRSPFGLNYTAAISLGDNHGCAIREGALSCWGDNTLGKLGNNLGAFATSPVGVFPDDVTAVAAGEGHTCAIHQGAVKCWGMGSLGQLGAGDTSSRYDPINALNLTSGMSGVAVGAEHSCAVSAAGALWCWGSNALGQLGADPALTASATAPLPVAGFGAGVSAVTARGHATCAIRGGALWCWGDNSNGQLGDGATAGRHTPQQVTGLASGVTRAALGGDHACAIHSGALKCWGDNASGQLGDATTIRRLSPVQVSGLTSGVTDVAAGARHTCAAQLGELRCFGDNAGQQLASERLPIVPAATALLTPPATFSVIEAGSTHSCGISGGAVYCWGSNFQGLLGSPGGQTTAPRLVTGMDSAVTALAVHERHACAIKGGALWCWGSNMFGVYGDGTTTSRDAPTAVPTMQAGVSAVAAGERHTCAVKDGAAYCWGSNNSGRLGDGTTSDSTTPRAVLTLGSGVTAIAAGGASTCAIQSGALKCWGARTGDGTATSSSIPVQTLGLTSDVSAVDLGAQHTCVVHAGAAKCWGFNGARQLGDGTSASATQPVQVVGLTAGVSAISAGANHSCAIHQGGAKCWGSDFDEQLGAPTALSRSDVPISVVGLTSLTAQIAAGTSHTCAVRTSGQGLCWGRNANAQAGYELTHSPTPLLISLP